MQWREWDERSRGRRATLIDSMQLRAAWNQCTRICGGSIRGRYPKRHEVFFFPNHKEEVEGYEAAADQVLPLITDWFGEPKGKANVFELPDPGSAPFETGGMTLMPMSNPDRGLARITLAHGITHAAFSSSRPWVSEGIAHFMQAWSATVGGPESGARLHGTASRRVLDGGTSRRGRQGGR